MWKTPNIWELKNTEQNIQGLCDNYERNNVDIMVISEREEREKGTDEIFKIVKTDKFSQINVGRQTTDLGSSETYKEDKCQNKN